MGKKRRNHPTLEEVLDRSWCYYCEREFEDLKLLISHQKAKHFKCERCGRRLNTAGGLNVHMNQVHKEALSHVENTLEGRSGLDVEIFGMEGIPEHALLAHNQKIVQAYYRDRADRQAQTGNPPAGQRPTHKKIKIETAAELKVRLAAYRAAAGARGATTGATHTEMPTSTALPQHLPSGLGAGNGASTLDDLVSGAGQPDAIDRVIRMAEAGVRSPLAKAAPPATASYEKSGSKKDKVSARMVYADGEFSLEEKIAQMPRYAVTL